MRKISIFASGSGSNAENIIQYFSNKPEFCIKKVFCNVPDAYVLERVKKYDISTVVFNRAELKNPEMILRQLQEDESDLIVLAGFLWLMPSCILRETAMRHTGSCEGLKTVSGPPMRSVSLR